MLRGRSSIRLSCLVGVMVVGDGVESEIVLARNRERLRRRMGYSSLSLRRLFF